MPLTFAHPAAVLPGHTWLRRWIPFPALVIGSMSPDFEYFLRLEPVGHWGHTAVGIILFCLPIGLIVYALYRHVIAPALPSILPPILSGRWTQDSSAAPQGLWRWVGAAMGIVIGATTHVIWDSFTHATGAMVSRISILQVTFATIPVYKFLQHGSTLIGLVVIAWWVKSFPAHRQAPRPWALRRVAYPGLAAFLITLVVLAFIRIPNTPGRVVVAVIDAGFIGLLICSLQTLRANALDPDH